jgi:hypothetical protein
MPEAREYGDEPSGCKHFPPRPPPSNPEPNRVGPATCWAPTGLAPEEVRFVIRAPRFPAFVPTGLAPVERGSSEANPASIGASPVGAQQVAGPTRLRPVYVECRGGSGAPWPHESGTNSQEEDCQGIAPSRGAGESPGHLASWPTDKLAAAPATLLPFFRWHLASCPLKRLFFSGLEVCHFFR